eukprot:CAMPEP_0113637410 /NCGR_PEP_ID=MMETSP0017_2-20120614/19581_1 /TAXON_ID=2856 /ORGANISM="Cylindrotheca closterium" /LENGTH=632 /DNA_ID=CAMNT_0000548435 /DNA_START=53 /DNA_END=1951 /DNA_ORIENTATION=+ /assembly_acc=CAM_ASM_000147
MSNSNIITLVLEDEGLLFSILSFCGESMSRDEFLFLSKRFLHMLSNENSFRWRLNRLHDEYGIYSPPVLCPKQTWKDLYMELFPQRNLWKSRDNSEDDEESEIESNKILACMRLKPVLDEPKENQATNAQKIVLPLHQRLALIRMSQNLKSNREALRVLQLQGEWFTAQWQEEKSRDEEAEGKDVTPQKEAGLPSLTGGVHSIDNENNRVFVVDPTKGLREFSFDHVLPDLASQDTTYDTCARHLVANFINGFNSTCLAYGQTGSGKSHTMFGPHDPSKESMSFGLYSSKWGIIPRACHEVFQVLEYRKANVKVDIDASVAMSYIEIYGDTVSDLLRERTPCGQSKVAAQRYVLDGEAEKSVASFDDAVKLLNQGELQKRTASTAMNERSSRAHTLLILTLKQKVDDSGQVVTSRLFLVDLGGSENLKKSKANTNAQRTKEAVNINLGLLALKKCATALNAISKGKKSHVPYADSKLTMLLSEGLGGNSKSCVILCAAQDPEHAKETLDTVAFGRAISNVSNDRKRSDEAGMLRHLLNEIDTSIAKCEENIRRNERWETKTVKQMNAYGEMETKVTTLLVGAESDRLDLEKLLRRRAQLTGTTIDIEDAENIVGFGNAHTYGMGQEMVVESE